jgi:hypothetical protein
VGQIYDYIRLDFSGSDQSGVLGVIFAVDGRRLNLGLFRPDVNVIWDLGPADISIFVGLMCAETGGGQRPGFRLHLDPNLFDLAYLELIFAYDSTQANIQFRWLDPRKVRTVTFHRQ